MLDYLRVRLPDRRAVWEQLGSWLGAMTARGFGWKGWYDQSWMVLDGGLVAACSDRERGDVEGILVDLPGRACGAMGERLVPFLSWALSVGGKVTRADFALDDRRGLLSRERILNAEAAGRLVTRWQGLNYIEDRKRGEVTGWTIYIGSRQSEAFCRVYDKAAEQNVRGHWVRLELECKGKLADALAREALECGASAVVGQVTRRIRFVKDGTDSNKRRREVEDWWLEFVGDVMPGASLVCGEKPEATIESMQFWVERQAAPTLAAIMSAKGGDVDWMLAMVRRGRSRLRPKHRAAMAVAE